MRYAETGFDLEIDLSRGSIDRVETDPALTRLYLGGLGINAKILWDRVPPETEAFSEDNLLIFGGGLLCGTAAPGCNRTIVSTFSPQTGLMAYSMMGGFWAPELKHAGYDRVIISGRSPDLVYLWIHNDKVEIRDASHLHGKGAIETAECIRKELKEPDAQVAAIGLAGENRVFYASIEQGRSSASRGGVGAVMGDKGLKAIAVRGTKDVNIARPAEFMSLCNDVLKYIKFREENPIKGVPPILQGLGSPQEMSLVDEAWHTTSFMWGNSRTRRKDFWTKEIEDKWKQSQESVRTRLISCYNCPMKCGATISVPGLPTYMMKCYSKLTYTMAAYSDLEFGFKIAQRATEYGVDGFSAPQVMAFALELYEAGILTDADFPGMPSDVEGRFFWLLDRIVRREGIGDVLADGTYWAAKRIGKGAEREEFVKDWVQVPDEKYKKYYVDWEPRGENSNPYYPTPEASADIVDWMEKMHYIDDALGTCAGLSSFPLKPPYHIHNYPSFISAAAGIDMDKDGLWQAATRNRTLLRAINVRRGLRRSDEKPPANHWKKRFPELEAQLLDTYYKLKGFDSEGIPTKESLHALDLGYVAEDFEQRGIFSDGQG